MYFSQFKSEHQNIIISKEKLIEFIKENLHGFQLEPVLEYGMCMLRSCFKALKDIFNEEFPVESIAKSLRRIFMISTNNLA